MSRKSNIIPFVQLKEYFSDVKRNSMGEIRGHCRVCNGKDVPVFHYPCWDKIREAVQEEYDKAEAAKKVEAEKTETEGAS